MKTLIITLEYPPRVGGIASYLENFINNWPYDYVIYAPDEKGANEYDVKNKIRVIRAKPFFKLVWPRWLKMLWQIWRICSKEKIDSIHVHHVLPVGHVAYLLMKIKRIPYTIFLHGTDLEMATRNKFKLSCAKKILNLSDKIVVNSEFLKRKLDSKIEGLAQKIIVLYPCPGDIFLKDCADESKKLRSQLALDGKKVIVTVARMVDGKGYPHLVRMLPKVLEKVPNLVWLVIGDGPKKDGIMKLVQKNYLQNVIRYLGSIPHSEIPKYYKLADLFVLLTHPDEYSEEGWGTVFLEAAACGLPVVAGRSGGVEEAVENMLTGVLVDIHQESSLISSIVNLLEKKDFAMQMGQAGKDRVEREFRWETQIKKII